jgi:hypothetical protein
MLMFCSNHSAGWQEPLFDIVRTNGTKDRLVLLQNMRGDRTLSPSTWEYNDRSALIGRSPSFSSAHEGR